MKLNIIQTQERSLFFCKSFPCNIFMIKYEFYKFIVLFYKNNSYLKKLDTMENTDKNEQKTPSKQPNADQIEQGNKPIVQGSPKIKKGSPRKDQHHVKKHHHEHYVDQHNHHHYIEPKLVININQLLNPTEYLMNIYKTKQKVDSYYMQNNQAYVDYWKREYGIEFTLNGYQLINYDVVINIEQFLKQNWTNVQYIGFLGSKIDEHKWRMFVQHADLFPNLKWICIHIKHTMTVKQGDLEVFKALKRIQFVYQQWTHPLTIPSKTYLKAFAKTHPQVQVAFG